MDHIILDKRKEEDIIKYIKKLASYYIPEWDFNELKPDMGVALAIIYANMIESNIDSLNELPHKYTYDFANILRVKAKPATRAEGYVTIDVVSGVPEGVYIKKGARFYANTDENTKIAYVTAKDLFAIDNKINRIYLSDPINNIINSIYDEEDNGSFEGIRLFDTNYGKKINEKKIYFGDENSFYISKNASIEITINNSTRINNLRETELLSNNVEWSFLCKNLEEKLIQKKNKNTVEIILNSNIESYEKREINGNESIWLKCDYSKNNPKEEILVNKINIKVKNRDLKADKTFANDIENHGEKILPFGERIAIYDEFYILSNEAFSKKGGKIEISFDLGYKKTPIDLGYEAQNVNWKMIMKERDFNETREYEISIENIIWEYWNGNGWARISIEDENYSLFNGNESGIKKIEFICPEDIKKNLVNAYEGYFIKARINKINNSYKTNGYYIIPTLDNLKISYDLKTNKCENIIVERDREQHSYIDDSAICLVKGINDENPTLYFEINKEIIGGPIKLYFSIDSNILNAAPNIKWEYYCMKDGIRGWHQLNIYDGTNNFSNSGSVTFLGMENGERIQLFGKEGYYLRAVNIDNRYLEIKEYSRINNILFNTVEVIQEFNATEEYYSNYEETINKTINLPYGNITKIEVWVNEQGYINKKEVDLLMENKEGLEISYYEDGTISEAWVKWKLVEELMFSKKDERHYVIDKSAGTIAFGNGVNGKIPPKQETESIKVKYSVGGGSCGNIERNSINTLGESIPFVDKIYNFEPTYGGGNKESASEAALRATSIIKRGSRIITLKDFERAIVEEFRNIFSCKVIPHYNEFGEEEIGAITIIVLPTDYFNGYTYLASIKKKIIKLFNEKAPKTLTSLKKVYIREVKYIEISVEVNVVVESYDDYRQVYADINRELRKYLDPVKGNYNNIGWNIGQVPNEVQLHNFLKRIDNVKQVKQILVSYIQITNGIKKEIDIDRIKDKDFVVPLPGINKINIVIE